MGSQGNFGVLGWGSNAGSFGVGAIKGEVSNYCDLGFTFPFLCDRASSQLIGSARLATRCGDASDVCCDFGSCSWVSLCHGFGSS